MILLTTLLLTVAILVILSILVISVTGAVGIVLFGDVIVCVFILLKIIKKIIKKDN